MLFGFEQSRLIVSAFGGASLWLSDVAIHVFSFSIREELLRTC
jgi:hypothetical protein